MQSICAAALIPFFLPSQFTTNYTHKLNDALRKLVIILNHIIWLLYSQEDTRDVNLICIKM